MNSMLFFAYSTHVDERIDNIAQGFWVKIEWKSYFVKSKWRTFFYTLFHFAVIVLAVQPTNRCNYKNWFVGLRKIWIVEISTKLLGRIFWWLLYFLHFLSDYFQRLPSVAKVFEFFMQMIWWRSIDEKIYRFLLYNSFSSFLLFALNRFILFCFVKHFSQILLWDNVTFPCKMRILGRKVSKKKVYDG